MSRSSRIRAAKIAFIVLCRQHEALGNWIRTEAAAVQAGDPITAAKALRGVVAQFNEIGTQLKRLSDELERL